LIGDFNEGMGTLTHIKLLNGKTMTNENDEQQTFKILN
jgi:hypothetical protein